MAKFAPGNRVKTTKERSSVGKIVPKGSTGMVRSVNVSDDRPFASEMVLVDWDGPYQSAWIDARFLEKR